MYLKSLLYWLDSCSLFENIRTAAIWCRCWFAHCHCCHFLWYLGYWFCVEVTQVLRMPFSSQAILFFFMSCWKTPFFWQTWYISLFYFSSNRTEQFYQSQSGKRIPVFVTSKLLSRESLTLCSLVLVVWIRKYTFSSLKKTSNVFGIKTELLIIQWDWPKECVYMLVILCYQAHCILIGVTIHLCTHAMA